MIKRIVVLVFALLALTAVIFYMKNDVKSADPAISNSIAPSPSLSPAPTLPPLPTTKILKNDYQVFQTFNNCGPAALSMALSYYGIHKTQAELGHELRPVQNPKGINDDKSVAMDELADKAKEYNLIPFHQPNGNIELLKQFINNDMPVITQTTLLKNDDIGHYRVTKGYDDAASELIQDDSMQGHNLRYSYSLFNVLWQRFNYEYLVLVPPEKEQIAKAILGEDVNLDKAWSQAVLTSQKNIADNPSDISAHFNLSIALYHTGDFTQAAAEFEKIQSKLSFRTLWYQTEPIQAYFKLGKYDKVLAMISKIFSDGNPAFSELYIIRGQVYKARGDLVSAKKEFAKAVFYNKNLKATQDALLSMQ